MTWIVLQTRQSARPLPFLALSHSSQGISTLKIIMSTKAQRTGKIQLFDPFLGQNKPKSRGGENGQWVIRPESQAKPELN